MAKFLYIFLTAVFIANTSYAQIRLSGKVTDKKSIAVDMATVVLKDSNVKIITGCISDKFN